MMFALGFLQYTFNIARKQSFWFPVSELPFYFVCLTFNSFQTQEQEPFLTATGLGPQTCLSQIMSYILKSAYMCLLWTSAFIHTSIRGFLRDLWAAQVN